MRNFFYKTAPFIFFILLASCESTESKIERLSNELKNAETPLKNTMLENHLLRGSYTKTDANGFAAGTPDFYKVIISNGSHLKIYWSKTKYGDMPTSVHRFKEISEASLCGFTACYTDDKKGILLSSSQVSKKGLTKALSSSSSISSLDDLSSYYEGKNENCNGSFIIGIGKKVFSSKQWSWSDEKQIEDLYNDIEVLKNKKWEVDSAVSASVMNHKASIIANWGKESPYLFGILGDATFYHEIISEEDYNALYAKLQPLVKD